MALTLFVFVAMIVAGGLGAVTLMERDAAGDRLEAELWAFGSGTPAPRTPVAGPIEARVGPLVLVGLSTLVTIASGERVLLIGQALLNVAVWIRGLRDVRDIPTFHVARSLRNRADGVHSARLGEFVSLLKADRALSPHAERDVAGRRPRLAAERG